MCLILFLTSRQISHEKSKCTSCQNVRLNIKIENRTGPTTTAQNYSWNHRYVGTDTWWALTEPRAELWPVFGFAFIWSVGDRNRILLLLLFFFFFFSGASFPSLPLQVRRCNQLRPQLPIGYDRVNNWCLPYPKRPSPPAQASF